MGRAGTGEGRRGSNVAGANAAAGRSTKQINRRIRLTMSGENRIQLTRLN